MSTLKTNNIQHVDRSEPSILINTDGGVSIAGTLTYEDVTNVDSVGIITARGLSIFGNTTGLQVASGISTFQAVTATSGTFTGGIDVTSNVTISDSIVHSGDTNTKIRFPAADTITTEVGGNEILRITSDSDILTQGLTNHTFNNDGSNTKVLEVTGAGSVGQYGIVNVSGNQNSNAVVGAVKFINRENSNSSSGANANSRRIAAIDCFADTSDSNGGDDCGGVLRFVTKADGGGGAEQMRIRSWGDVNISNRLRVAGISTFTAGIRCTTDGVANGVQIGASNDLILQHNGTNSFIDNNTGDLYIQTTGSGDDILLESADNISLKVHGSEDGINITGDGAVQLYFDNSEKIKTTSSGVTVTGSATMDGATVNTGSINMASSHMQFSGNLSLPNVGACIFRPVADTIAFGINNGQRVSVNQHGLLFGTDTSSANALDDYEEGVYAPTLTGSAGGGYTVNSSYNKLAYTKVGRIVHVTGRLRLSAKNSPSGDYIKMTLPTTSNVLTGNGDAGRIVGTVYVQSSGKAVNDFVILPTQGGGAYLFWAHVDFDGTGFNNMNSQMNGDELVSVSVSYVSQ